MEGFLRKFLRGMRISRAHRFGTSRRRRFIGASRAADRDANSACARSFLPLHSGYAFRTASILPSNAHRMETDHLTGPKQGGMRRGDGGRPAFYRSGSRGVAQAIPSCVSWN